MRRVTRRKILHRMHGGWRLRGFASAAWCVPRDVCRAGREWFEKTRRQREGSRGFASAVLGYMIDLRDGDGEKNKLYHHRRGAGDVARVAGPGADRAV